MASMTQTDAAESSAIWLPPSIAPPPKVRITAQSSSVSTPSGIAETHAAGLLVVSFRIFELVSSVSGAKVRKSRRKIRSPATIPAVCPQRTCRRCGRPQPDRTGQVRAGTGAGRSREGVGTGTGTGQSGTGRNGSRNGAEAGRGEQGLPKPARSPRRSRRIRRVPAAGPAAAPATVPTAVPAQKRAAPIGLRALFVCRCGISRPRTFAIVFSHYLCRDNPA